MGRCRKGKTRSIPRLEIQHQPVAIANDAWSNDETQIELTRATPWLDWPVCTSCYILAWNHQFELQLQRLQPKDKTLSPTFWHKINLRQLWAQTWTTSPTWPTHETYSILTTVCDTSTRAEHLGTTIRLRFWRTLALVISLAYWYYTSWGTIAGRPVGSEWDHCRGIRTRSQWHATCGLVRRAWPSVSCHFSLWSGASCCRVS